jgi:DNA invertase Pin-like site-specific DNA recombinase
MERPGLHKLLADIAAGQIDVVVVYKVDRLTRSLMDFAKIVEVFDRQGVSFVSVTQAFNTTTSMGRLTLNVLLSFAQFEREVTGERIRDKIAASKKKGLWMGGFVPIGYEPKDRTLVINESEADAVRTIYALYLEIKSVDGLKSELDRRGFRTKLRPGKSKRMVGGHSFSRGTSTASSRTRSTPVRSTTRASVIPVSTRLSSTARPGMLSRTSLPATGTSAWSSRGPKNRACSPGFCTTATGSASSRRMR